MTVEHPRAHLQELVDEMTQVDLDPDDPAVDRLVCAYRAKYGLGARDMATERAFKWRGVMHRGNVVAVFGERLVGRALELTDAYHDETSAGLAGFTSLAYGYLGMLHSGQIDRLSHVALFANTAHWRWVMEVTGDVPMALVFVHERKGG